MESGTKETRLELRLAAWLLQKKGKLDQRGSSQYGEPRQASASARVSCEGYCEAWANRVATCYGVLRAERTKVLCTAGLLSSRQMAETLMEA